MPLSFTSGSFKILPHMCFEQRTAMRELLDAADDIGAAASSMVTQGGQGYSSLIVAQNNFKDLLSKTMAKSRFCIQED